MAHRLGFFHFSFLLVIPIKKKNFFPSNLGFFYLYNLLLFWINCFKLFLYSYDDKVACQMILDKKGLKGYQVIQVLLCNHYSVHAV